MRSYGKIETGFWLNPKVKQLSEDGRILLLYIYSCPHGNSIGCFVLHDGYIAADLGWKMERVAERVTELANNGFIARDEESNLMLVKGWFGHNTIENRNVAKAAMKTLLSLPKSPLLMALIIQIRQMNNKFLNEILNELPNEFINALGIRARVPEPEPKPEPEPEPQPAALTDFQKVFDAGSELFPQLAFKDTSPIRQWLNEGCDPEQDIIPTLKRFAGKDIGAWKYFSRMIADSKATRLAPMPQGQPRYGPQAQDWTVEDLINDMRAKGKLVDNSAT